VAFIVNNGRAERRDREENCCAKRGIINP